MVEDSSLSATELLESINQNDQVPYMEFFLDHSGVELLTNQILPSGHRFEFASFCTLLILINLSR